MAHLQAIADSRVVALCLAHGGLWILGLAGLMLAARRMDRHVHGREQMLDRQRRLTVLQQSLLGPGSLAAKLKQITDAVVEVFDADFCRVWVTRVGDRCDTGCIHADVTAGPHVCRHRDKCLHLLASSGRYTHVDGEIHRRVPFGCYKIGRVAAEQDGKFLTNDVTRDPRVHNREWAAGLGLVSFAGYPLRRHSGENVGVLALFAKHPISRDDDALLEALGNTVAQVIEQCLAEERLRIAHAELAAASPSVLISVSPDGRVLRWNRGAAKTLGVPSDQAVGRALAACPVRWPIREVTRALGECTRSGERVTLDELRFTNADGNEGFLALTVSPLPGDPGQDGGALILGADITERKILQGQLTQAQKLEAIGQLAAGIAHEINTPIQYVGDNTRFIRDSLKDLMTLVTRYDAQLDPESQKVSWQDRVSEIKQTIEDLDLEFVKEEIPKAIEQTLMGVDRVTEIIRAMKDFSHPGVKGKTPTDLNRAIESTVTVARNEWKYVADLELDLAPNLPPVDCLPGEFNQVILNMITNAAHAIGKVVDSGSDEKGTITVSTRRDGDWVEIRLGDTGTGIPPEVRQRVFDPFFTTKEVGRGTGQGLSISRSVIVDKHCGTMQFETEVGKGTTFVIRLPVKAAPATDAANNPGGQETWTEEDELCLSTTSP